MEIRTVTKRENSDVSWRDSRGAIAIICVFLIAMTWFVFGQTVRYDLVNYDDDNYVYANPLISSGLTLPGAVYAFSGKHAGNWHPLTTLSHMLDCQLWGSHAGGHHLTNIVLHTIAVVLLFLILLQMTGACLASIRAKKILQDRTAFFSLRYLCGLNCACAWRRPSAAALNSGLRCSAASNSGMLSLGFPDSRRAHPRLAWAAAALSGSNRTAS